MTTGPWRPLIINKYGLNIKIKLLQYLPQPKIAELKLSNPNILPYKPF